MDERLEAAIDEAAHALARKERGMMEHPSIDELVDYQEGRLDAEEAARVRHHLAVCQDCADDLLDLEDWDAAEPTVDPSLLPSPEAIAARRQAFEEMVQAEERIPAATRPMRPTPSDSWKVLLPLAASVILAATGIGFWLAAGDTSLRHGDHPFLFNLVPEGSGTSREAETHSVEVPAGFDLLVARLNVSDLTPFEAYRAEMSDSQNNVVWVAEDLQRLPGGSFSILLDRFELDAGSYQLKLLGEQGQDEVLLETYSFTLSFQPSQ